MNRHFALATASAIALVALTAGAPTSFAATTHGLSCKAGTQAMRVMEKGKHVWRCEPLAHHSSMAPQGTMAPHGSMAPAPAQGTTY